MSSTSDGVGVGVEGLCRCCCCCCCCRGRLLLPRACLLSTAKSPGQAAAASRVSWEPLLRTDAPPLSLLAAPPFPFPLPLPMPPSLPLKEAEIPEALSQEIEGRTSVATAAKGEGRKPKKLLLLRRGGVVVAAVIAAVVTGASPSFLLRRSVAEASTRRWTLFEMSGTIVQERSRRQETWTLLKEADAERAAGEEEKTEVKFEGAANSKEGEADDAVEEEDGLH